MLKVLAIIGIVLGALLVLALIIFYIKSDVKQKLSLLKRKLLIINKIIIKL